VVVLDVWRYCTNEARPWREEGSPYAVPNRSGLGDLGHRDSIRAPMISPGRSHLDYGELELARQTGVLLTLTTHH